MRELAPGLWVVETPFRMYAFKLPQLGVEVGRRMIVCTLGSGELWINSPAPLTDEVRAWLDSLGQPRFVVAPNAVHGHRFMEAYRDAYPGVELFAAPVLDRRRRDLAFDGVLGSAPDPRWSEELDQAMFAGHFVPEVVFLHRSSRTLIVGDLLTGRIPTAGLPLASRLYWGLEGLSRSAVVIRSYRLATVNRRTARRSLEQILAWDFDRIVVGHGEIVESGGRLVLGQAMRWLRSG